MKMADQVVIYLKTLEEKSSIDYLEARLKREATQKEREDLEEIISDIPLPKGVLNLVIDYTLQKNNDKFSKNYIATIARSLARDDVTSIVSGFVAFRQQIEERKKIKITD